MSRRGKYDPVKRIIGEAVREAAGANAARGSVRGQQSTGPAGRLPVPGVGAAEQYDRRRLSFGATPDAGLYVGSHVQMNDFESGATPGYLRCFTFGYDTFDDASVIF